MVHKCKNCGEQIVKYPIKKNPDKTLQENLKNGDIIWSNLFKMDLTSVLFLIAVVVVLFGYQADIEKCNTAINDPCTFCNQTGCMDYNTQSFESQDVDISNFNIPEEQLTDNKLK